MPAVTMEDNSSDDEIREGVLSPKLGGKKLKMNDGSSQESVRDAGKDPPQFPAPKKWLLKSYDVFVCFW